MKKINLILSLIIFFSGFLVFFLPKSAEAETGLDVSFSGEYSFNNASTSNIVLTGLTETKFIIAYQDGGGNLNYGRVRIGEILDGAIDYGPGYDFNPTNTSEIAVMRLSDNKFAIAYQNTGNYKYGGLIIGEFNGNEINFGQEYFFNQNTTGHISLALLSEDKIVIVYSDGSSKSQQAKVIIGTITGTEVSFGQNHIFNYSAINYIKIVALSENKFVVFYEDSGSSEQGVAVIGSLSGENISFGQEYVFNPTETNSISAIKTGENVIAVFYDDEGEISNQGRAVLATINESSISFSNDFIFNHAITGSVSASLFDVNKILIAYQNKGSSDYGELVVGQISNRSVSFDSNKYIFYPSETEVISVDNLSKEDFILIYRKATNNLNYGIGIAGIVTGFIEEPQPEPQPEPPPAAKTPLPQQNHPKPSNPTPPLYSPQSSDRSHPPSKTRNSSKYTDRKHTDTARSKSP